MEAQQSPQIRVSRQYGAPPERVFAAWTEPALARQWLFATPGGRMQEAEIDARDGGSFRIVELRDGKPVAHDGVYTEVLPPLRLAFDFTVTGFEEDPSHVEVDITPFEGAGCTLTLRHEGVPAGYVEPVLEGWETLLDSLDKLLVKGPQSE